MGKLKIKLQKRHYKTQNIIHRHPTPKLQQQQLTLIHTLQKQQPQTPQKHQISVHTSQQIQLTHTLQKQQPQTPQKQHQTTIHTQITHTLQKQQQPTPQQHHQTSQPPYTIQQPQPYIAPQQQQISTQQPLHTPLQQTLHTPQTHIQPALQHNTTFLTRYQGYEIWEKDLQTLGDGRFLNDIVINVMLTWTKKEIITGQHMDQVCICNSHWFEGLRRGKGAISKQAMLDNLHVMRKWYPQGTPFSAQIAVVPVCHKLHWVGFIVAKEQNTLNIWSLDSLGSKTTEEVRPILEAAINICHPTMEVAYKQVAVSQQTNGSDCRVWLLHNIIRALQHLTKTKVPDAIGLEIALTDSPTIGRKEVRE